MARAARTRSRVLFGVVAGLATAVSACDRAVSPAHDRLLMRLVHGGNQRAFWNDTLPQRLRVVVEAPVRNQVVGIPLTFIVSGGGSIDRAEVRTGADGGAEFAWRLGRGPEQKLIVRAAGSGAESNAITVVAESVDPATADVIAVRSVRAVPASIVAFDDAAFDDIDTASVVAGAAPHRFLPFRHPASRTAVAVFADGHPPSLIRPVAWSEGSDSLAIDLAPAAVVPVTVWILDPALANRSSVNQLLARTDSVWRVRGVSLEWSNADVIEVPVPVQPAEGAVPDCGGSSPDVAGFAAGRLNIYIGAAVAGVGAQWCGSHIYASAAVFARPTLLAHELGHAFALGHSADTSNLMHPRAADAMTDGQVFIAHFHYASILNAWFGRLTAGMQRDCYAPVLFNGSTAVTRCPHAEFHALR